MGTVNVRPNGRRHEGNRRVCFSCGAARSAGHGARAGMVAAAGELSQDGRRRRTPLATAASHEWRRGTLHKHWACPGWPSWMGTAAAVRRTDGGRRPEATRSVTAIRLELGDRHLPDKARRAFVFEGHSYAFARQVTFTEAASGRTARVRTNGSAQTCDLRYFGTPTSVGRRQRQLSGSSFLGSCLCVPIGC
jgi:hypothetical protein